MCSAFAWLRRSQDGKHSVLLRFHLRNCSGTATESSGSLCLLDLLHHNTCLPVCASEQDILSGEYTLRSCSFFVCGPIVRTSVSVDSIADDWCADRYLLIELCRPNLRRWAGERPRFGRGATLGNRFNKGNQFKFRCPTGLLLGWSVRFRPWECEVLRLITIPCRHVDHTTAEFS